jgi:hypothetical protein
MVSAPLRPDKMTQLANLIGELKIPLVIFRKSRAGVQNGKQRRSLRRMPGLLLRKSK